MPFESKAQRRWFYANMDKDTVDKWESETEDENLPEKKKQADMKLKELRRKKEAERWTGMK